MTLFCSSKKFEELNLGHPSIIEAFSKVEDASLILRRYTRANLKEHLGALYANRKSPFDIPLSTGVIAQHLASRASEVEEVTYLDAETHFVYSEVSVCTRVIEHENTLVIVDNPLVSTLGVPSYSSVPQIDEKRMVASVSPFVAFAARLITSYFRWDGRNLITTIGSTPGTFCETVCPDVSDAIAYVALLNLPKGVTLKGKALNEHLLSLRKDSDNQKALIFAASKISFKCEVPDDRRKAPFAVNGRYPDIICRDLAAPSLKVPDMDSPSHYITMHRNLQLAESRFGAANIRRANPDAVDKLHLYSPHVDYLRVAHALDQIDFKANQTISVSTKDPAFVQAIVTVLEEKKIELILNVVGPSSGKITVKSSLVTVRCMTREVGNPYLRIIYQQLGDVTVPKVTKDITSAYRAGLFTLLEESELYCKTLLWMPYYHENRLIDMDSQGHVNNDKVYNLHALIPYDHSKSCWPCIVTACKSSDLPPSQEALSIRDYIKIRLTSFSALISYPISHHSINSFLRKSGLREPHFYDFFLHRKHLVRVRSDMGTDPIVLFPSGKTVPLSLCIGGEAALTLDLNDKEKAYVEEYAKEVAQQQGSTIQLPPQGEKSVELPPLDMNMFQDG
jgi:hypothetical protein